MRPANPGRSLARLPDILRDHSIHRPDAPALLDVVGSPLTYGELWDFLSRTVCLLNGAGLTRDSRVALVMPNGSQMAALFLCVASGMTAAPLNPQYQLEEFRFYLEDLGIDALLIQSDLDVPARQAATALNIPIYDVEPIRERAGLFHLHMNAAAAREPTFGEPGDTALILHTSGTTARPKIVPLTIDNLMASAGNIRAALQLTPNDRCLNIMPLFHIHGLMAALVSSLAAGASVVCTPGFYTPEFFSWLDRFQPTWYTAVPTMHQAILARADANREVIARASMRFIRSSSSSLPKPVFAALETTFGVPVIEAYGMTEAAHQIAINPLPPGARKPGTVGKPHGVEVAILDAVGSPLPAETEGEIAIRGANVMGGYENAPQANARSFVADWLRTGDQGRLDADGYLTITGRLKEIINRGGEKIAPREVDEVLLSHPAVAQAATFAIPHPQLGEDVAAVVVLEAGQPLSDAELRAFAAERLAYHKIPHVIVFRDEIPKGATGKIQRLELAAQLGLKERPIEPSKREMIPPRTPLEAQIAAIWADVLHVETVGVVDNFLDLGGDSMLALRVVGRLRDAFQVDLNLGHVLETPTIADIALLITQTRLQAIDQAEVDALLAEIDTLVEADGQRPPDPPLT